MSGNMYENVVTWNPLAGECIHKCGYCYMQVMRKRYNNPKWFGEPRIDEKALSSLKPKNGSTVFVQSINDLFADNVHGMLISRITRKAREYATDRGAKFLFQSRNVVRMLMWAESLGDYKIPEGSFIGTTLESDDETITGGPYDPLTRCSVLRYISNMVDYNTFITIEPIMSFNLDRMLSLIKLSGVRTVNIGANSKGGSAFQEPTAEEVLALIRELEARGIQVVQKSNLARIMKGAVK